jgi:hypothetical protein
MRLASAAIRNGSIQEFERVTPQSLGSKDRHDGFQSRSAMTFPRHSLTRGRAGKVASADWSCWVAHHSKRF